MRDCRGGCPCGSCHLLKNRVYLRERLAGNRQTCAFVRKSIDRPSDTPRISRKNRPRVAGWTLIEEEWLPKYTLHDTISNHGTRSPRRGGWTCRNLHRRRGSGGRDRG